MKSPLKKWLRFRHIPFALFVSLETMLAMGFIIMVFNFDIAHLTALASSAFSAFAVPKARTAKTVNLIGSYILATIFGMACAVPLKLEIIPITALTVSLLGALSIGLLMFFLITHRLEHPPSAGVALGFVVHFWNWRTPLHIIAAICFLVIFRYIWKSVLPEILHKQPEEQLKP